jgi:hypothetical protein
VVKATSHVAAVALNVALNVAIELGRAVSGGAAVETEFTASVVKGTASDAAAGITTTMTVSGITKDTLNEGAASITTALHTRLQLEGYNLVDDLGNDLVDDAGDSFITVEITA